jgi:hypothetical protein
MGIDCIGTLRYIHELYRIACGPAAGLYFYLAIGIVHWVGGAGA